MDDWPPENIRIGLSARFQWTDGSARCVWVAVCNDAGESTGSFLQGERAHFFFEFEILRDIEVPSGGMELVTAAGVIVHGKNTFQCGSDVPLRVARGSRLRFHQSVELRVAAGQYHFNIGLAGTDPESYRGYAGGPLSHQQFAVMVREHCRVLGAGSFEVAFGVGGKLSHHGLADLPGGMSLSVLEAAPIAPVPVPCDDAAEAPPTVFHITHWKAGSQWIHKILRECWPNRIVEPQLYEAQVRHYAIQRGYIYPTVYLSKQDFDDAAVPPDAKRFVVIRDLRDTLVSGYFSFKYSHPIVGGLAALRQTLGELDMEAGLLHLMDQFLLKCAKIQLSWLESSELILRYEDLLENDVSLLEQTLIERCGLPVTRERLREAVVANRFESVTRGRPRGREDITSHERKGIAGDWRNHFTGRVKSAFKARYGGLLVATGYEKNLDW